MDERHVVQPHHLPRQKFTNTIFQANGQEVDPPEPLPHEGSSENEDEMKTHSDSLQINRDATPPPELVGNASSTARGKTRGTTRRPRKTAPGKRRKTTSSSSSENGEEFPTRRTTRRVSIPPARNLRARKSRA